MRRSRSIIHVKKSTLTLRDYTTVLMENSNAQVIVYSIILITDTIE